MCSKSLAASGGSPAKEMPRTQESRQPRRLITGKRRNPSLNILRKNDFTITGKDKIWYHNKNLTHIKKKTGNKASDNIQLFPEGEVNSGRAR